MKTERHEAVVTPIAVQFYSNSVTRYARVADQGIRGRTGASCRAGLLIPPGKGIIPDQGSRGGGLCCGVRWTAARLHIKSACTELCKSPEPLLHVADSTLL